MKGTTRKYLWFGNGNAMFIACVDKNMASDVDSRKFASRYLITFPEKLFHGNQNVKVYFIVIY